jgi:predicted nucleic acid-binding protein
MDPLKLDDLPPGALLLVDTSPIIYVLEDHPQLASRFLPIFDGRFQLAVTTITIAEVLTGPMKLDDRVLAMKYRHVLQSWRVVSLDIDIAENAAYFRATYGKHGLKLPDAVQIASARAIQAYALVTNDQIFNRLFGWRFRIVV